MNVLIIGSGGREHALAWKVAQADTVSHVYVAPGNAGTQGERKVSNVDIDVEDIANLTRFAKQENVMLHLPLSARKHHW